MEDKRLKQFTFYDLYYEALKGLSDEAAGRMVKTSASLCLQTKKFWSRRTTWRTFSGAISRTFSKKEKG